MLLIIGSCTTAVKKGVEEGAEAVGRKVRNELGEKVTKKVSAKVEKKGVGKTATLSGVKSVSSLSSRELAQMTMRLQNRGLKIKVSSDFTKRLFEWSEKNSLKESDVFEILDELDGYVGFLGNERRYLQKKVGRTSFEEARLEKLTKMFEPKEKLLTKEAAEDVFKQFASHSYQKSTVISPKRFAHVVFRHCNESAIKSWFIPEFKTEVFGQIESLALDKTAFSTISGNRVVKIRDVGNVIGRSHDGANITELAIILDKDGTLVTAFPAEKDFLRNKGFK